MARSPYEPIGFKEERLKRMRATLEKLEKGIYVPPDEMPNPYDLNDMALVNEIMLGKRTE